MQHCKKAFILFLYLVAMTLIVSMWSAVAHAQSESSVVEKFFTDVKAEVLKELNRKIDTTVHLYDCFENPQCEQADEILDKYKEYRIYFGLLEYNDLKNRMRDVGQGFVVYNGARVDFTTRTQNGRNEWQFIKELHQADEANKASRMQEVVNGSLPRSDRSFLHRSIQSGARAYYASVVESYQKMHPFFGEISAVEVDRAFMSEKIAQMGRKFETVYTDIENLGPDDRFEMMGFLDAVENVVETLSAEESEEVANYLASADRAPKQRFIDRIISILSSTLVQTLLSCHVATYGMAVFPHPVVQIARLALGFICSAVGMWMTAQYWGESTVDLFRQLRYAGTGLYDPAMTSSYIKSYVTTSIMSALYIVPSLPGLSSRAVAMRHNVSLAVRARRLNRLSVNPLRNIRIGRSTFRRDVEGLLKSYGVYYGEELAVNAVLTASANYFSTVSVIRSRLITQMQSSYQRFRPVLTYSDVYGIF